jgi:hypothetical protein
MEDRSSRGTAAASEGSENVAIFQFILCVIPVRGLNSSQVEL